MRILRGKQCKCIIATVDVLWRAPLGKRSSMEEVYFEQQWDRATGFLHQSGGVGNEQETDTVKVKE